MNTLKPWERVWREGLAHTFSDAELAALLAGLESDDLALCQGKTTIPIPLRAVEGWELEGGDPLVYGSWKAGAAHTVGEGESAFARRCAEADLRLGHEAAVRFYLNHWDDTPRTQAFAEMAYEVRRESFLRKLRPHFKSGEFAAEWVDTPNPAFGGRTPSDLLGANDVSPLEEMIFQIEGGVAT